MSELPGVHPPLLAVREAVGRALAEDLLPLGDITASLLPSGARTDARLVARAEGVLAGRACATEAFGAVDPSVAVLWEVDDGSPVVPGRVLAAVLGPAASVLSAERTALNFLCHLSGVATLTRRFVEVVAAANPGTRILDTRKTTPGLRPLEKAAVRAGGGVNHRGNLSEGVLVKDNHLGGTTIATAVATARDRWPGRLVEVECDRPEQVLEAVESGAGQVLLDNMTPEQVAACVALVRDKGGPGVLVEISGGVSLETAGAFAAAGVDLISVGAITHSAPALDIGLDLAVVEA
ncbi:MAG: carboxylating nicotinate-nucleotide diphosphorylase [Actinobacteria bacterium]|nr:MAG: carboxylating nicotinate-nucleotide diphosphorylase [Actinomycetota bacterium]